MPMHIVLFCGLIALVGIALLALAVNGVLYNRRVTREAVRLTGVVVSSGDESVRDKEWCIEPRDRHSTVEAMHGGVLYTMVVSAVLPDGALRFPVCWIASGAGCCRIRPISGGGSGWGLTRGASSRLEWGWRFCWPGRPDCSMRLGRRWKRREFSSSGP